ncbi:MAG: FG-GAP-like repeat-containing protein [Bryobacteraceae bacterium]
MNLKIILPLFVAVSASAQSVCPPINFLNATTINLDPTDSSHLVVLRQSDGSYTAFEMANASPYPVLRTIPHFEKVFSNCLPRQGSPSVAKTSPSATGAGAQPAAFAVLDSGNYLFVSSGNALDVAVFDQQLKLVSENSFAGPSQLAPGDYSSYVSLILTDVNGDGKLDLVAQYEAVNNNVGQLGTGGVQVFLGDGAGGFELASGFTFNGFVSGAMAVGDLNGDGKLDIVVGAPPSSLPGGGEAGLSAGSIVLALGKGDGTFVTSSIPTPGNVGPAAIAIADLNGDGKNDLVFLTSTLTESSYAVNEVIVMLGKGDGTFLPQVAFAANASSFGVFDDPGTPGAIAIGDVNGDGIPDIVTNGITILLGDGKGGFPTRKDFLNADQESVILTDFDGDGKIDIVIGIGNPLVLSQGLPNTNEYYLSVFFGDGTGGLTGAPIASSPTPAAQRSAPFTFPPSTTQNIAMTSGDFNKDGVADLAFVSEFQYLSVFLGSSSGVITPTFTYDFTGADPQAYPTSVVAADFNGDRVVDLAVTVAGAGSSGSVMVFLGKGDGTFQAPVSSAAPGSIWSLVTGDFNKDGRVDLAAINTSASSQTDQVVVFLGQGDGTFASAKTYPAGAEASALAIGDFNQDGFTDIAVANLTGINLLLGKGGGTFSPGTNISFPVDASGVAQIPGILAAADLNGDGNLDLVVGVADEGVAVLLGHGDGTFAPLVVYPTEPVFLPGILSVVVGDFNGDGIPDLFLNDANVFIGNGDGTFRLQTTELPGDLFGSLIAADFNGDGKLDLAASFFPLDDALDRGVVIFFNLSQLTALLNVVSAADFSQGPFAPHSIASAFGQHLALSTASATPPSLPSALGGASVSVQDQTGAAGQAEIYYASPGQVNFVLPAGLEAGAGIVTIKTADGQSVSTEIQIAPVAPTLFILEPSGIPVGYAVQVSADNVQTIEAIFTEQGGIVQEVPIDVSSGEVYLVLFGTGFDSAIGAGAQIYPTSLTVTYAGPQSQFPGLDQINILLPKSLAGSGQASLELFFYPTSIAVNITIK